MSEVEYIAEEIERERQIAGEAQRVADELEHEVQFVYEAVDERSSWCRVTKHQLEDWAQRLRGGR